jgi:phosphoribosylformylglycinamidine synthase
MMAALSPMIPGAQAWPRFTRNRSEQFEARLSLVEVLDSPASSSPAWPAAGMPIAVAHGEGLPTSRSAATRPRCTRAMRFVDHHGRPTEAYPFNPNGSPGGLTAVTTPTAASRR